MTNGTRRVRLAVATATLSLPLLAGCGTPPWQQQAPVSPEPRAATVSPSPKATTPNDLAKGSLKRRLSAGGVTLSTTYYSTLAMQAWTPTATKPLTVALSGAFGDGSTQDIFLSAVTASLDVRGADGPLTAPEPLTDQADVTPGYLITAPSSYSNVFTIPALPAEATSLTVNLSYELLAQSAPRAKTYLKQTAGDTVVIALAPAG